MFPIYFYVEHLLHIGDRCKEPIIFSWKYQKEKQIDTLCKYLNLCVNRIFKLQQLFYSLQAYC